MNLKKIEIYLIGIWAIFSAMWYIYDLIKFLSYSVVASLKTGASIPPYNFILFLCVGLFAFLLLLAGIQFIRIKKMGLNLLTVMIVMQIFYAFYMFFIITGPSYFKNLNIPKLLYITWYLIIPPIALICINTKQVKNRFS